MPREKSHRSEDKASARDKSIEKELVKIRAELARQRKKFAKQREQFAKQRKRSLFVKVDLEVAKSFINDICATVRELAEIGGIKENLGGDLLLEKEGWLSSEEKEDAEEDEDADGADAAEEEDVKEEEDAEEDM